MKDQLYKHFPPHKMRIELFFGAGGSYFYLPKPKYAILNDLDDDVYNLYKIILNQKEQLIHQIKLMPITESLVKDWKKNIELDPLTKAIRFLLLSNFTYLGKGDTLRFGLENVKKNIIKNIEPTFLWLQDATLMNSDFREVVNKINFSETLLRKEECFIYMDPIYLDTTHFYKVPKWSVKDTEDCFKIIATSGIPSAMSEFDNEKVLQLAADYKMNVIFLTERRNINNRRNEILITNYSTNQVSLNLK
ncbi:MAG: DNA adenine methylase [Bacteroidetes bacterium]|nr:DNA adenine methylase [Bacteroidota bacterium]